jgi:hypothetical protein
MKYHRKNICEQTEKMKARILKVLGDEFMTTKTIARKIAYRDRIDLTRTYLKILEDEGKIVHQLGRFPKWTAC